MDTTILMQDRAKYYFKQNYYRSNQMHCIFGLVVHCMLFSKQGGERHFELNTHRYYDVTFYCNKVIPREFDVYF